MMFGLFCGVVLLTALQAANAASVCDSVIDTSGTTRILLDTCQTADSLLSLGWVAIDGDGDVNTVSTVCLCTRGLTCTG